MPQTTGINTAAVPFFNVYSVLILSFSPQVDEEGHLLPASHGMEAVKKACINVAKNPLILGILAGLPFSLLRIQVPVMLDSALSSIGGTATPIALLVVGASFSGSETLLFAFLHVIIKFTNVVLLEDETNVFARSSARWRGNPFPFPDRVRYRNVRRGTDCHVGLCTPRNDILIRYVVL